MGGEVAWCGNDSSSSGKNTWTYGAPKGTWKTAMYLIILLYFNLDLTPGPNAHFQCLNCQIFKFTMVLECLLFRTRSKSHLLFFPIHIFSYHNILGWPRHGPILKKKKKAKKKRLLRARQRFSGISLVWTKRITFLQLWSRAFSSGVGSLVLLVLTGKFWNSIIHFVKFSLSIPTANRRPLQAFQRHAPSV